LELARLGLPLAFATELEVPKMFKLLALVSSRVPSEYDKWATPDF
jgi:hypothetical protein